MVCIQNTPYFFSHLTETNERTENGRRCRTFTNNCKSSALVALDHAELAQYPAERLFNCMKAMPVAWHISKTEWGGSPAPRGLGGQARQSKYHHRTGQRLRSLALDSCIVQLSFLAFLLVLRGWCIVTNPKPSNRATSTQILRQIAPSAAELELIKRTIKRSGKPGRSSNHVYYAPELRLYTYPRAICWCVLEKKSQLFLTWWKIF